jgi:hypothetical protein
MNDNKFKGIIGDFFLISGIELQIDGGGDASTNDIHRDKQACLQIGRLSIPTRSKSNTFIPVSVKYTDIRYQATKQIIMRALFSLLFLSSSLVKVVKTDGVL